MKNIFVYGDSNTWGYFPTLTPYSGDDNNTKRFPLDKIWWNSLTKKYNVYYNGVNGRTINSDHYELPNRNACKTIDNDFVNENIDLVILMLGTNDLKDIYNLKVNDLINHCDLLIKKIKNRYQCDILLICPPLIYDTIVTHEKYSNGINKIKEYEKCLFKYTQSNNYYFVSGINAEVGVDGEHLTEKGHNELGQIVLEKVNEIFKR